MSYCSSYDIVIHHVLTILQTGDCHIRIFCTSASLHVHALVTWCSNTHHTWYVLLIMMSHIRDMWQSYKCWVQLLHGLVQH